MGSRDRVCARSTAVIAPGIGSSNDFVVPPGPSGAKVLIQGLVISPVLASHNGIFAITNGHEIQFL